MTNNMQFFKGLLNTNVSSFVKYLICLFVTEMSSYCWIQGVFIYSTYKSSIVYLYRDVCSHAYLFSFFF